jgi:hypothetical protein
MGGLLRIPNNAEGPPVAGFKAVEAAGPAGLADIATLPFFYSCPDFVTGAVWDPIY